MYSDNERIQFSIFHMKNVVINGVDVNRLCNLLLLLLL